jgi:DNA-3-methyladenine glycosylase II
MNPPLDIYRKAQRHLARRDPILKDLIKQIGHCTLAPDPDRFNSLVRAIIAQQISTKAARAIHGRLHEAMGKKGICPAAILRATDDRLRAAGLSSNKARSLRDLAEKVKTGLVPLDDFHDHDEEAVIEKLVLVRGIGRWTAEMFLIFSLGRLDVLAVDDFGFRAAVQRHYQLKELPNKKILTELAEPWRPYRSLAMWYMWRSAGFVPRSDGEEA